MNTIWTVLTQLLLILLSNQNNKHMNYSLLNSEGDFLLVTKIDGQWYFKILSDKKPATKKTSIYSLVKTNEIEILSFLRGSFTLRHEEKEFNYLSYGDFYKSRGLITRLIGDIINDINTEWDNHKNDYLDTFAIPRNQD